MSAPPPPPPTYNESMHQQGNFAAGGYQPNYGAVNQPPAGQAYPPQGSQGYGPPAGAVPSKQEGYYPPQAGYPPPAGSTSQQYAHHSHQSVVVAPPQNVVLVGGCPACRVGVLEDDFTCCGVLCAILFFPLGILCCLAMRQRRCANCGAIFG